MKKPTGLGRGLSALIDEQQGQGKSESAPGDTAGAGVREIEIGKIRPNPHQPRKSFDEEALGELTRSIQDKGVLQPILVRSKGAGFEIVAGERRWRAAQRAQLHRIPAIVRELDEEATAEIALIENIQREDLTAIEEAQAYHQLIARYNHTQEVVAGLVGKSRSHVANLLRLLDLPSGVQQMILRNDISMGHARALLGSENPIELAEEIVASGLSVRQVEKRVRAERNGGKKAAKTRRQADNSIADADIAALERQLGDMLGLNVKIAHGSGDGRGGSVTLNYKSLDQLDMICQRLSGETI